MKTKANQISTTATGIVENLETHLVAEKARVDGLDTAVTDLGTQVSNTVKIYEPTIVGTVITVTVDHTEPIFKIKVTADHTETGFTVSRNGGAAKALQMPNGDAVVELLAETGFYDIVEEGAVFTLAPKGAKLVGDATVNDVLLGKTFSNADEVGLVGGLDLGLYKKVYNTTGSVTMSYLSSTPSTTTNTFNITVPVGFTVNGVIIEFQSNAFSNNPSYSNSLSYPIVAYNLASDGITGIGTRYSSAGPGYNISYSINVVGMSQSGTTVTLTIQRYHSDSTMTEVTSGVNVLCFG